MTATFSGLLGLYDVIRRDPSGLVTVHYVIASYLGIAGPEEPLAASDVMAAEWADPDKLGSDILAPKFGYHRQGQKHHYTKRKIGLLKLTFV